MQRRRGGSDLSRIIAARAGEWAGIASRFVELCSQMAPGLQETHRDVAEKTETSQDVDLCIRLLPEPRTSRDEEGYLCITAISEAVLSSGQVQRRRHLAIAGAL